MFFKRTTAKSVAVIDAFHAAAPKLRSPEHAVAQAAFAGIAQAVLERHRTRNYRSLPRRLQRDLALVLVLVHDDQPSFDRALVAAGIPIDDLVALRERAVRRDDLLERARLAMRMALAEARAVRRAARAAALATAAGAAAFEDPLEDILLAPEAGRLAA
ncbi:hypothetical protein PQJ75_18660 [Rhodoplanes sp. TEM]|uniref:Uncharacterized protein n=1 Tax=Rhodoplanes tepidamans TaxID=200616 RepID=A0ABT5JJR2_RHOTP|nr:MULTISPECIES: hypothetical protein [Rhodoplanes]MDC7789955.1 hypothetical protein [Rhodoplanes tepidamans]MDC7985758.1 hypothetical protein [Rhodoplanes sp. TEM]MDQ0357285.1 hypothetical protein [Rhodoplanes tepidamans]